jgi:hypothetical protein
LVRVTPGRRKPSSKQASTPAVKQSFLC